MTGKKTNADAARSPNFITRLGSFVVGELMKTWMSTLDIQVVYADWKSDPAFGQRIRPGIFCFWHEYIPFLCYCRPFNRITMLASQHRDADWLVPVAKNLGFGVVRGSRKRGGAVALRKLLRQEHGRKLKHLAITPDGPRGPRRVFHQGAVYLASRLQIPIIPVGLAYERPWRLNSWDKFAIPRPFSRARAISGMEVDVPQDADRDVIEAIRQQLEQTLNQLTADAEDWADTGRRYVGQQPLLRQAAVSAAKPILPQRFHRYAPPRVRQCVEDNQHSRRAA